MKHAALSPLTADLVFFGWRCGQEVGELGKFIYFEIRDFFFQNKSTLYLLIPWNITVRLRLECWTKSAVVILQASWLWFTDAGGCNFSDKAHHSNNYLRCKQSKKKNLCADKKLLDGSLLIHISFRTSGKCHQIARKQGLKQAMKVVYNLVINNENLSF